MGMIQAEAVHGSTTVRPTSLPWRFGIVGSWIWKK